MVKIARSVCALAILAAACAAPELTFKDEPIGAGGGAGVLASGAAGDSAASGPSSGSGGSTAFDGSAAGGAGASNGDAQVMSCTNHVLDGAETDVDCGGAVCPLCGIGAMCRQDTDCIGAYCKLGVCARGSCIDGAKNLKETDVDCGGGDCPPCGVGMSCVSFADCAQQSCIGGKCQSMSCDDRLVGVGETDVDCGGPSCAPCAPGKHCLLARDCASAICDANMTCASPSCTDGVLNGSETGKDCGGGCAPCSDGAGCMIATDCASGVCASRLCQAPRCDDRIKNQGEADVDCGGPCPKCGTGATCGRDADCGSGNCATTCQQCPKDMVKVPTTSGTSSYCIDATEVTIGGYSAFLQSSPSLSLLPSTCSGKTSFVPGNPFDTSRPTYPVSSVDWCDAYAYCANLGRHLCGRIGGGATLASTEGADASKAEWYNACSKGGTRTYCYGSTFNQNACVDNQLAAVGSAALCVGGFPGIHDMNGNVAEWEDNCQGSTGLQDLCATRGGSVSGNPATCATQDRQRRNARSWSMGFRCCL